MAGSRNVFPLVPRHRVAGLPFGGSPSLRRGHGTEVAGSRPYVRGDPVSTIDWRASARLSTARGRDEFVVRERYAEEAPRVVLLCDLSPTMAFYEAPFPWLSKPAALRTATDLIIRSAQAAGAAVAYLDLAGAGRVADDPYWLPPRGRGVAERIMARLDEVSDYDAPPGGLSSALEFLGRSRSELSSGTFVFVISDFLAADLDHGAWLVAAARRWEIVPVVVQDPVWEQSFPEIGSLVVPLTDPASGVSLEARVTRRRSRALRAENELRRRELLRRLADFDLDPVLVGSSEPDEVERSFLAWAAGRRDVRLRR